MSFCGKETMSTKLFHSIFQIFKYEIIQGIKPLYTRIPSYPSFISTNLITKKKQPIKFYLVVQLKQRKRRTTRQKCKDEICCTYNYLVASSTILNGRIWVRYSRDNFSKAVYQFLTKILTPKSSF